MPHLEPGNAAEGGGRGEKIGINSTWMHNAEAELAGGFAGGGREVVVGLPLLMGMVVMMGAGMMPS